MGSWQVHVCGSSSPFLYHCYCMWSSFALATDSAFIPTKIPVVSTSTSTNTPTTTMNNITNSVYHHDRHYCGNVSPIWCGSMWYYQSWWYIPVVLLLVLVTCIHSMEGRNTTESSPPPTIRQRSWRNPSISYERIVHPIHPRLSLSHPWTVR